MNVRTLSPSRATPPPRFDAKFIEEHHLIERYLDNKLPVKGARELENWCRANPDYLAGLNVSGRAEASLKLLEASGRALDLREQELPWWRTPYMPLALGFIAAASLLAFWTQHAKLNLLRGELDDARTRTQQGSLVPTATAGEIRLAPDRSAGIDRAKFAVSRSAPQLMDVHIDLGYTTATQFRLIVDKRDQGRALVLNNLLKDSNGELRLTFNTTGLAIGTYSIRIDALPSRASGIPQPEGWLMLEVH